MSGAGDSVHPVHPGLEPRGGTRKKPEELNSFRDLQPPALSALSSHWEGEDPRGRDPHLLPQCSGHTYEFLSLEYLSVDDTGPLARSLNYNELGKVLGHSAHPHRRRVSLLDSVSVQSTE